MNPKTTSTITIIPTTATISSTGKDNRPAVNAKAQTTSGYLRESLDELNRLSGRVDNTIESEVNRLDHIKSQIVNFQGHFFFYLEEK